VKVNKKVMCEVWVVGGGAGPCAAQARGENKYVVTTSERILENSGGTKVDI
jgi:hypothetical protein